MIDKNLFTIKLVKVVGTPAAMINILFMLIHGREHPLYVGIFWSVCASIGLLGSVFYLLGGEEK